MKKFIALTLVSALALTASITAFAATITQDTSDPKTTDTVITTSIKPTYTVTIPADVKVVFNAETTSFGQIKVDSAQIEPDKCIKVSLTTDGKLKNTSDKTKVIPYTVKSGENTFTSATYLATGEYTDLTLKITKADWNKAYAGDYEDTVTFEVSYENKA